MTIASSYPFDETVIAADSNDNDMGEVIVTGTIPDGGGYWFRFGDASGLSPREVSGDGSGTFETPSYYDFMQAECLADLTTDMIARQIEALIKAQPDWNAREYGAVIYMVGNEVRMGPLLRGTTLAEAQAAGGTSAGPHTDIYAPADLGDGVILAVVHSHPSVGYGTDYVPSRYPSDKVGSGDYFGIEQLVGSDSRFGNNAAFAQYILGPDGVLREFNFSDGRLTAANDPDPNSRSNLAKDRPCLPD